jgi:hypothetical protein
MAIDAPWLSAFIPLISMLLAAGLGMRVRLVLKEHHRDVETTDLLRVTVTMLVTFAAIVLGLLITSSKANFDTADSAMQTYAATLSDLNDALQDAGSAAAPIRRQLAQYTAAAIASTWTAEQAPPGNYYPRDIGNFDNGMAYESAALGKSLRAINAAISQLPAQTAAQDQTQKTCASAMSEVFHQRWATIIASQVSLSTPIFVVLVFWLFIVFLCLGLSTPMNALSAITIGLTAIALASALFVVADLNGLYSGIFMISSTPMRSVLAQMLSSL